MLHELMNSIYSLDINLSASTFYIFLLNCFAGSKVKLECRVGAGGKNPIFLENYFILKIYKKEIWFLWSGSCLMMLYISVKLHENIFNSFQDTEQTRFCVTSICHKIVSVLYLENR